MSDEFTASRRSTLITRLHDVLLNVELADSNAELGEVAFTKRFVLPAVRSVLNGVGSAPFVVRGDGAEAQAVPAVLLGHEFYPDVAVAFSAEHFWALEVKFLRDTGRNDSLAKAIGQAALYRTRYEYASVLAIDWSSASRHRKSDSVIPLEDLGLNVLLRRA